MTLRSDDELPPRTPAERARWIFAHSFDRSFADGRRVVELLLGGRDLKELSEEELELLARGYNWWGKQLEAFETSRRYLAQAPNSQDRLLLASMYASNAFCFDLAGFIAACDACITESLGPAAFWHMRKADEYIAFATGERELEDFEWSPGDEILHPESLRPAADSLADALACSPGLREDASARGWVGNWNQRFAAVVEIREFAHLSQPAGLSQALEN